MRRKISSFISLSILLSMASGCSDELKAPIVEVGDGICFEVSEADSWLGTRSEALPTVENPLTVPFLSEEGDSLYVHITCTPTSTFTSDPETRGELKTKIGESETIGLFGFPINADGTVDYANPVENINNVELKYDGSVWKTDANLTWSGSNEIRFIAYYPYKDETGNVVVTHSATEGVQVTYNCDPKNPANNQDLLVAAVDASQETSSNKVTLNFRHPLATIVFKAAEFPKKADGTVDEESKKGFVTCKVTELAISDTKTDPSVVPTTGPFLQSDTYTIDTSLPSTEHSSWNSWKTTTAESTPTRISVKMQSDMKDKIAGDTINSGKQTFMVIPEKSMLPPATTANTSDNTSGNTGKKSTLYMTYESTTKNADGNEVKITKNGSTQIPIICKEGYTTTYTISNTDVLNISDTRLYVTGNLVFPYYGTTKPSDADDVADRASEPRKTINIVSQGLLDGEWVDLAWEWVSTEDLTDVKYNDKGGWLDFPKNSVSLKELGVRVDRSKLVKPNGEKYTPHKDALREAEAVGLTTRYDLSTNGSTDLKKMNTANCYLVNAAGHYKLPLVYGNAIKNGVINRTCGIDGMTDQINGVDVTFNDTDKPAFVDGAGNKITDPKISIDDIKNYSAVVVWQDVEKEKRIISNPTIQPDNTNGYYYLYFDVDGGNIQPANAVIAIKKGDVIVWSWHIWITDYKLGQEVTKIYVGEKYKDKDKKILNDTKYQVMPYTIGYCPGPNPKYYYPRKAQVTVRQISTGDLLTFEIDQQYFEEAPNNNTVTYQWGRKDPFIACSSDGSSTDPVFSNSLSKTNGFNGGYSKPYSPGDKSDKEQYVFEISTKTGLAYAASNPFAYINNKNWFGSTNIKYLWDLNLFNDALYKEEANLYNETNKNKITIKTLYDPSPAGYCVAHYAFFYNVWKGQSSSPYGTDDDLRVGTYKGIWLFCNGIDPDDGLFFYPASGERNGTSMKGTGRESITWSSARLTSSFRYRIYPVDKSFVIAGTQAHRGNALLCIKEEIVKINLTNEKKDEAIETAKSLPSKR